MEVTLTMLTWALRIGLSLLLVIVVVGIGMAAVLGVSDAFRDWKVERKQREKEGDK